MDLLSKLQGLESLTASVYQSGHHRFAQGFWIIPRCASKFMERGSCSFRSDFHAYGEMAVSENCLLSVGVFFIQFRDAAQSSCLWGGVISDEG